MFFECEAFGSNRYWRIFIHIERTLNEQLARPCAVVSQDAFQVVRSFWPDLYWIGENEYLIIGEYLGTGGVVLAAFEIVPPKNQDCFAGCWVRRISC